MFLIYRKSISNGVQTKQKFLCNFSGPEDTRRKEEVPERQPRVGTTHQAVPGGPGTPLWVVAHSGLLSTASSSYKSPNIPKPPGVTLDQKFRRQKPLYPPETNRDPFPAICRRGESSPEAALGARLFEKGRSCGYLELQPEYMRMAETERKLREKRAREVIPCRK